MSVEKLPTLKWFLKQSRPKIYLNIFNLNDSSLKNETKSLEKKNLEKTIKKEKMSRKNNSKRKNNNNEKDENRNNIKYLRKNNFQQKYPITQQISNKEFNYCCKYSFF